MTHRETDSDTANPYRQQLLKAGVPEAMHDMLRHHGVGDLVEKMEITFLELTRDRVVATMPVRGNTQVTGLLHGGAHVVLAETLGSFAAGIHAGLGSRQALGIEIGASHHRAATEGLVVGTCTPIHLGRTLTTHEIVMTDEQGRRLSTVRMTNMIKDTKLPQPDKRSSE
ncbi:hotdog fold thioesterase [Arthrobacter russicus]|uniref:Uncharacterized protein (TIGR00369 family) n=1 Tax=Arthrobacter russicus TaxID=172040 RepID=A0ABU1JFN6_9MICC|nr:hotdog fold thioesterase [Arthrobacter russicus]MBQ1442564.1 hotdog fold thioesterase [Renibacterium sp.]MDN5670117.1 hotdog fold thioesterase [Renibacterium salmoninarum]MDR6271248.1 uncharacterized protein (TIGR00369 family) [Arthrobacter russicus]